MRVITELNRRWHQLMPSDRPWSFQPSATTGQIVELMQFTGWYDSILAVGAEWYAVQFGVTGINGEKLTSECLDHFNLYLIARYDDGFSQDQALTYARALLEEFVAARVETSQGELPNWVSKSRVNPREYRRQVLMEIYRQSNESDLHNTPGYASW